jgi:hypothetical protein
VIAAAAVAGACLFIAIGLAWSARLVHIGTVDALELADKLAVPKPVSALDWPELRVRAVVPQDVAGERSLVLLLAEWPARHQQANLLVDLGQADQRSLQLLSRWCADRASVSPGRCGPAELELRRRQSLERVRGFLIAEDTIPGARC